MKKKKITRIIVYIGLGFIILAIIGKQAGWFGNSLGIKVSTEIVEKRTIVENITANGRIQPETEVKISPDVSGEIVELHIKEGDKVNKGDLMIKIKQDYYKSSRDRVSAALNSAKSNLANARAQEAQRKAQLLQAELSNNRNKLLWEQKAISQADYENAYTQFEVTKAQAEASKQSVESAKYSVKSAEASLREAEENLRKTTIYAPIDGIIFGLKVEKGERVVGTAQMAGTELLRIADLKKMEVKVDVNENDIIRVNLGDTALIEIDSYLNHKFKGIVTEIANSANTSGVTTDQVTSFDVKVFILNESFEKLIPEASPDFYPFRPGMSATVDIQTTTKYDILTVPISAVTTRIDSTKIRGNQQLIDKSEIARLEADEINEIVFLYEDGVVKKIEVKSGIQDNNYIEIISGLEINDEIVVAPYNVISKRLVDGMDVERVDREDLFKQNK